MSNMKLLSLVVLAAVAAVPVRGLAVGAPASSCYDFNITHNGFDVPVIAAIDCNVLFETRCNILEASIVAEVDEVRTNITLNPATYKCGGLYSVRIAYDPELEGFLVQARSDTAAFDAEASIWGAWDERSGDPWHTLNCKRSKNSPESTTYPNSVTHKNPNVAGTILSYTLYWRAPTRAQTQEEYNALPSAIAFWYILARDRERFFEPMKINSILLRNDSSCEFLGGGSLAPSPSQSASPVPGGPFTLTVIVGIAAGGVGGVAVVLLLVVLLMVLLWKYHSRKRGKESVASSTTDIAGFKMTEPAKAHSID